MACHFGEVGSYPDVVESPKFSDGNRMQFDSEAVVSRNATPFKENPALRPVILKSNKQYNAVMKTCAATLASVASVADGDFCSNTALLENRAREVDSYRGEIQAWVQNLRDEITSLDELRRRLQRSLVVLRCPETISEECSFRRTRRINHDNVCDSVDCHLVQEEKLCKDVRDAFSRCLSNIESQLETNKVCKNQLEFDWSEKTSAFHFEVTSVGLQPKGPVEYSPGATRLQTNQSTPDHWLHYTKELMSQGKIVMDRSIALRNRTGSTIEKAASDLRTQADAVEIALKNNIASTQQALEEAERELNRTISQISTAETLHGKLLRLSEHLDVNMKISQTRLFHRAARPHAENTRDCCQRGLINEVARLNEGTVCIHGQMDAADATLQSLYESKSILEDTILVKRKSLYIDRQRCLKNRQRYPDSLNIAGF